MTLLVVAIVALAASIMGAVIAIFAMQNWGGQTDAETMTPKTGLELIDAFSCPKGLTKQVVLRGIPDNFDRTELELAQPRPENAALGVNMNFDGTAKDTNSRQYDEGGADKKLLDQFTVPRGIVSGELLIGLKAAAENSNDSVGFEDAVANAKAIDASDNLRIAAYIADIEALRVDGTQHIYALDLEADFSVTPVTAAQTSLGFFNSPSRPDTIDFLVADDTIVDFAALLLCKEPAEPRGTIYREYPAKVLGPEMSLFSCNRDRTQSACDLYRGDISCQKPSPIACYKDGNRKPKGELEKAGYEAGYFVGGEVRLSAPVVLQQFTKLKQADAFCAAEFGENWRVLEANESGTAAVASYSDIPVGAYAAVNVTGQPYANCWDRPKSRLRAPNAR